MSVSSLFQGCLKAGVIPDEALVLLDEALEALPPELIPSNWLDRGEPYKGPVLTVSRCVENGSSYKAHTWTVGLDYLGHNLLEWWDDHWVRLTDNPLDHTWMTVWRGRKLDAEPCACGLTHTGGDCPR